MKKLKLLMMLLILPLCSCRNQAKDVKEIKTYCENKYSDSARVEVNNVRYIGETQAKYESTIYTYHIYQYDLCIYYKEDGYTKLYYELNLIYNVKVKEKKC